MPPLRTFRSVRRLPALAAACPAFLAHQEFQARTADQANLVPQAQPVFQADHHQTASQSRRHHASHALQAHQAQLARLARQEMLDPLAHRVDPARTDPTATQAQPAQLAQLAQQAQTEMLAQPARISRSSQLSLVTLDPLVMTAPLDRRARPEMQAKMVLLVDPAQLAIKDQTDQTVPPVPMELQDQQAHLATPERRVPARNTARWTAVSSSRAARREARRHKRRSVDVTDGAYVKFLSLLLAHATLLHTSKHCHGVPYR